MVQKSCYYFRYIFSLKFGGRGLKAPQHTSPGSAVPEAQECTVKKSGQNINTEKSR